MAGSADIDYEVYRFLSKRITADDRVEYLVRWKGFNSDWDSWEPAENLQRCGQKISNFEKKAKLDTQNYAKKLVNRSKMMKKDPATTVTVKQKGPGRPKKDEGKDSKGTRMQKKTELVNVKQASMSLDDVFESVLKGPESVVRKKSSPKAGPNKKAVVEKVESTPKIKRGVGRPKQCMNKKVVGDKRKYVLKFNSSFNQRVKLLKADWKKKLPEGSGVTEQKQAVKTGVMLDSSLDNSVKRKYTKRNQLFWKNRGNSPSDTSVFITDVNDNVTPDTNRVAPTVQNRENVEPKKSGVITPDDGSAKRKYIKRNKLFWETRSSYSPTTEDSHITSHVMKTQSITNGESLEQNGPGDKLAVKYHFKLSKKNSVLRDSKTDKSLLSLSENSKLIKHKRMFKSSDNKTKSQFKVSLSRLLGGNKMQGQNLKHKRANSGKDGVRKRGPGRPPRVTVQALTDDESSDEEEVLYSLARDPSSNSSEPMKARAKSDTGVKREKKSPEPGQKRRKKHRRKSDGLDLARISKKQKMRLLDSLKAAASNAAKPVRPVSPTPLFTTVKPSAATATVLPSSKPLQPHWAVEGESPTEATNDDDDDQASLPLSPATMSYKVLLENLPQQLHPKKTGKKVNEDTEEDVERRVSVRATECVFKYKEILIKKFQKYTQIWLNTHTKMKNALNPLVIQEISSALSAAKYDDSTLVMLSGLGNVFCSGIDLHFLTSGDRRVAARQMGDALRDLIRKFTTFPKLIVAVVTGPAIGLGTAILPLCDIVYASDKATFYLPYGQLAQTPEGCASFTLPQCCGTAMASELLIGGRKITAIEACQLGLVSQVYWPTSMMQEVIPRVQHMATLSGKALETTKLLIRSHQRTKLDLTNESECNLLVERWPTQECQKAMEEFLCNEKNYTL